MSASIPNYTMGDRFIINESEYILATTGKYCQMILIDIITGASWNSIFDTVENDYITHAELVAIIGKEPFEKAPAPVSIGKKDGKWILKQIENILINDGPDGHIDGSDLIASFIKSLMEGKQDTWMAGYETYLQQKEADREAYLEQYG